MQRNSSFKNISLLNLNKCGDNHQFACGSSDHPMMPSINDLLYASKKEIDSFNSLISNLRPNSTLESLMLNDNTVPSFNKKCHLSNFSHHRKGHRKKKNDRNHHSHLNFMHVNLVILSLLIFLYQQMKTLSKKLHN